MVKGDWLGLYAKSRQSPLKTASDQKQGNLFLLLTSFALSHLKDNVGNPWPYDKVLVFAA
jgi:hypothetical protein